MSSDFDHNEYEQEHEQTAIYRRAVSPQKAAGSLGQLLYKLMSISLSILLNIGLNHSKVAKCSHETHLFSSPITYKTFQTACSHLFERETEK